MKKIILILFFSFLLPTFSYGQKSAKAVEQEAKAWTLRFAKMDSYQKSQAARELVYFLNNTDGYTKGIWLASMEKYAPKEDEVAKQKRLKAEEEKKREQAEAEERLGSEEKRKEQEEKAMANYARSDYAKIISKISGRLDNWLIKAEFEKTEDYNKRLQSANFVFDTICYKEIVTLFESENNSERLVTPMLGYEREIVPSFRSISGPGKISLDFAPYDADNEFYPLNIQCKGLKFTDRLHMPIDKAKKIWSEIEKYDNSNSGYSGNVQKWREFSVEYPKSINEWVLLEHNLFPTKVILNFGDKDHTKHEVKFLLDNAKRINISSSAMELKNYHGNPLTFELDNYLKKINDVEIQKLIKEGEQFEANTNYQEAIKIYKKALEIDPSLVDVQSKVIAMTNQMERSRLLAEAEELYKNGYLSKSRQKYDDANNIKNTVEIATKISSIDKLIGENMQKHTELESKFSEVSSNTLFDSNKLYDNLEGFKRGYGTKYKDCIFKIDENLSIKKGNLSELFNVYKKEKNTEQWTYQNQQLLEMINSFNIDFIGYKVFEDNLMKALQNEDKKFLKILKEDDEKIIIETVSKSNYTISLN